MRKGDEEAVDLAESLVLRCSTTIAVDRSSRSTEEHLDHLTWLSDQTRDRGVVVIATLERPATMLNSSSGKHSAKHILIAVDPTSLVANRYRAAFGITTKDEAVAFIIDRNGLGLTSRTPVPLSLSSITDFYFL